MVSGPQGASPLIPHPSSLVPLGGGGGGGRIYDLGYQPYTGPREGRRRAVQALFWGALRRAWGIGRPFRAKLAPWSLLGFALVPAVVALGIAALGVGQLSPFKFENYYDWVSRIFLLFCTAAAPELLCPDLRQRVLTLYFSRAIERLDYVLARLAALIAALAVMALTPQLLLFIGNMFVVQDTVGYLKDNLDQLLRIFAAGLLISLYFGSVGLAIAAYTTRRIYAAGIFIALMLVSSIVFGIVQATLENDISRYLTLLSLSEVPIVATAWIFDAGAQNDLAREVDLPLALWVLATLAYTAVALFFLLRRYVRLAP